MPDRPGLRPVTHQTVRLERGSHRNPEQGACVMELASMLAGEPFSDRPASACPVVGAFLRAYNDALDDRRRQDLYPMASAIVGTATTDGEVVSARIRMLAEWGRERASERARRWLVAGPRGVKVDECQGREVGLSAVRAIRRIDDRVHASALELIERLVAVRPAPAPAAAPAPRSHVPEPEEVA